VATRVVVIGADAAGMSAAHQALRVARRTGRSLEIVVLERTQHTSYSACGIPYWLAGDVAEGERLVARTAQQHRDAGIDLRLGVEAVALDLAARTVTTRDVGDGSAAGTLAFDELVLATGAHARVPAWARGSDGRPVPGVRAVKTLDDGAAWIDLLLGSREGRPPRRAVVVGGGYIGIETAEAFLRRGLETTVVTRGEIMGSLDPDMGARVRAAMVRAGVEVSCSEEADGLERGADGRVAAVLAGGRRFEADVVALGLGAVPSVELAAEAGLPLGAFGGLLPDERQRVADGVWAAGDCCEVLERHGPWRVYVPLGTHANKQGRVAGENLAGGDARFEGVLGTAITRFVAGGEHVEISRTGPTRRQALAAGAVVQTLVTESTTASSYMPEASPIAVKVAADPASRRLIAVQIVGGPGAGKRIDTAAAAIWCGARVDDVAQMDLAYAPPFSPVYDPVQIACRRLADLMSKQGRAE
jgi:NADPH-dependent 2,4-dienoyl-CoA reductase/sulfur reductase-like enzyme